MSKASHYLGHAFEALEMAETRLGMAKEAARLAGDSDLIARLEDLEHRTNLLVIEIFATAGTARDKGN